MAALLAAPLPLPVAENLLTGRVVDQRGKSPE
jgi:hypothetical protein